MPSLEFSPFPLPSPRRFLARGLVEQLCSVSSSSEDPAANAYLVFEPGKRMVAASVGFLLSKIRKLKQRVFFCIRRDIFKIFVLVTF